MMLLLHVLMLSLLSGGSARVLINTNFEQECGQFFANGRSPTRFPGLEYKQICQTLNGVPHYATYYDMIYKIPVYSAYKFEGTKRCTRQTMWYIEPQLDYNNGELNMASESSVPLNLLGYHQALNEDYKYSGFHKGHLAPVYHARSQRCAEATFTLTNAAPQNPRFNSVSWWNVEKKVAQYLKRRCDFQTVNRTVYIVTGVVPGNNYIGYNEEDRVNVPSHFWTAYCCLDQNNRCSRSRGIIGTNVNNSVIREMTVVRLERELQILYGNLEDRFRIFQQ